MALILTLLFSLLQKNMIKQLMVPAIILLYPTSRLRFPFRGLVLLRKNTHYCLTVVD